MVFPYKFLKKVEYLFLQLLRNEMQTMEMLFWMVNKNNKNIPGGTCYKLF